jgi:hypothetical protein
MSSARLNKTGDFMTWQNWPICVEWLSRFEVKRVSSRVRS